MLIKKGYFELKIEHKSCLYITSLQISEGRNNVRWELTRLQRNYTSFSKCDSYFIDLTQAEWFTIQTLFMYSMPRFYGFHHAL